MNKLLNKYKKETGYFILFGLTISLITLRILPADFFDTGQSICVSVMLFDMECYGCGMTRAIQHLIHFEFSTAASYNKLSFIVFPLAVFMIIWEAKRMISGESK